MEAEKLRYYEKKLLSEKERLEVELTGTGNLGLDQSLTDSIQELSAYDNHPADLGTETFERGKDLALRFHMDENYQQTTDALGRIRDGSYGRCKFCGRDIGHERLEALPATPFCFDCREKVEEIDPPHARPIEEKVLFPPFGRTFLDGTDNVATDGEDIWQDVARYGTSETPSDLGGIRNYENMYIDEE